MLENFSILKPFDFELKNLLHVESQTWSLGIYRSGKLTQVAEGRLNELKRYLQRCFESFVYAIVTGNPNCTGFLLNFNKPRVSQLISVLNFMYIDLATLLLNPGA